MVNGEHELICLVDDDSAFREALSNQLAASGIVISCFGSATEYLTADVRRHACVILDLHLPDINGLELQRRLTAEESPQVIFISGRGDIPSSVRAIKAGALEFLTKPIDEIALLEAIRSALARDQDVRRARGVLQTLRLRLDSLTPREREVLPLVVGGSLNKHTAAILGLQEVTVQVHRAQIMRKMEAESFADLVRMAAQLGIRPSRGSADWQNNRAPPARAASRERNKQRE